MQLPTLNTASIRAGATSEVYARGMSYHHRGAVGALVLRGDRLSAEVEGSEEEPYRVAVQLGDGEVLAAHCTCPYDWGGWCKHIVAALLAYAEADPSDVEQRPPLAELLAPLDREQLVALLLRLADSVPDLADEIEGLVPATRAPLLAAPLPAAPPQSVPQPPPTIDLAAVRRQVRDAFRGGQVVATLEPVAGQVAGALAAGDVDGALAALEAITEVYAERWLEYDNDEGELGDFLAHLGRLWAEALLDADLSPDERETWSHRLGGWNEEAADYGIEGLELAILAADEGWDAPWLAAAMRGEPAPELLNDWDAQALLSIRLRVLERKGLLRDALNLAVATGRASDRARLLVRLGRAEEAGAVAAAQFRSADEALTLATALLDAGDSRRALAVAKGGLELRPPRAPLASWLVERAAAAGDLALALRAGQLALAEAPELALYQRLQALAGRTWPDVSARLQAALRQTPVSWQTARGLVDVWLHAGLIDEAIAVVEKPAGAGELSRVVDAAGAARPEWAVATAQAQAEAIAEAGRSDRYEQAIDWLQRARDLQRASVEPEAWERYVATFRARFGRKIKLMGLLDKLERRR